MVDTESYHFHFQAGLRRLGQSFSDVNMMIRVAGIVGESVTNCVFVSRG